MIENENPDLFIIGSYNIPKIMIKIFVAVVLALSALSGCQTTSLSTIKVAKDSIERRKDYYKVIADTIKIYPWFNRYTFSRPNTLVVKEARIEKIVGWLHGRYTADQDAEAVYCLTVTVINPDNDNLLTQAISIFRVTIFEDTARPGWLQAQLIEGQRQPRCMMVGDHEPLTEIIGHRFHRPN